jgi:hypothetical protein
VLILHRIPKYPNLLLNSFVDDALLTARSCSQSGHLEGDRKGILIMSSLGRVHSFVLVDIIKTAIGFNLEGGEMFPTP